MTLGPTTGPFSNLALCEIPKHKSTSPPPSQIHNMSSSYEPSIFTAQPSSALPPLNPKSPMEGGESVLDVIYEDENMDDVEMIDVEEGEVVDDKPIADLGQSNGGGDNAGAEESQSKNRKRRANKKKNRKKRGGPGPNVMDINRFVLDTCRRLKEKKSYMVYTAVACLGVSAVSDLVKEVDAIQSCGGQTTADGRRSRTGGGILWNILKTRETVAYGEIMKKAKEFEKQFRQQNVRQAPESNKEGSSQVAASSTTVPDAATQNELGQSGDGKRRPVHERIRAPVSYDDLPGDDPKGV